MICSEESEKNILADIFMAGVKAVSPLCAIMNNVSVDNGTGTVRAKGFSWRGGTVRVVGAGKGAGPMADALEDMLGPLLSEGVVAVKYGHASGCGRIKQLEAAHPVPDWSGIMAARAIMDMAAKAGHGDLTIAVLTGGASALTPCPAPGISLDDLARTTHLMLASGADIGEINAVRKHVSLFGGGALARAAGAGRVLGLVVSDVIGDRLDIIASGPLSPDSSTFDDCARILRGRGLWNSLPDTVARRIMAGVSGSIEETARPGEAVFDRVTNLIIANNGMALGACALRATRLGLTPVVLPDAYAGEARHTAIDLLARAKAISSSLSPGSRPVCLLAGGETTVTIRGQGRGGRNQEMALAASLALNAQDAGITALFAGTDGSDGPTDAAGGFAVAGNVEKMGGRAAAVAMLDQNDSNLALKKCGSLFMTGPTLTNVMDICAIVIRPAQYH